MDDNKEKIGRVKELSTQIDFSKTVEKLNKDKEFLIIKDVMMRDNKYWRRLLPAQHYITATNLYLCGYTIKDAERLIDIFIQVNEIPTAAKIITEEWIRKTNNDLPPATKVEQAKEQLKLAREMMKDEKRKQYEEKMQRRDEKEQAVFEAYMELPIEKFIIYQNKDESTCKVVLKDKKSFNLNGQELLKSGLFRTKYFLETGHDMPPPIDGTKWAEIINVWKNEHGEIIDNCKKDNTDNFMVESIIHELNNFIAVNEPMEALNYGRVYFNKEEPYCYFVYNRTIDSIRKKMEFKISVGKLRFMLEEHLEGESRVIRTSQDHTHRFLPFKRESLISIKINSEEKEEENDKEKNN